MPGTLRDDLFTSAATNPPNRSQPTAMNVADSLTRGRRLFPDKTALIFEDGSYSYRALDGAIDGVAARLAELGIGAGERVGVLFPNHPHLIMAWFAVQRCGAIAVLLAPSSPPRQLVDQLADCAARVVLTTAELAATLDCHALPSLEQVCVVTADWERPAAVDVAPMTAKRLPPDAPAAILYTSGTTGAQKGVTLSHGALRFNAEASVNALRLVPDDRVLACLPLSHSFSITAAVNTTFEGCATLVVQPTFDPDLAVAAIAAHRITVLPAVPPVFRILLDTAAPARMASLRLCLSAAIRLPTATAEGWAQRFGLIINEGYGTTETSLVCFNHPLKYRSGSVGAPLTGVELSVRNDDGTSLSPMEAGEVWIRADSRMLGYWGRDEATANALCDGWYRSGDLGYLDEDGYLFLTDRKGDVINSGGRKLLPSEIEQVLLAHPSVAEVAVFAANNALLGEDVRAAVVLRPDSPWQPEAVAAHCRTRLPDWQVPHRLHVLPELPKARSGKILKRELRQRAEAGELNDDLVASVAVGLSESAPAADAAGTATALEAAIAAAVAQVLGTAPAPRTDLRSLGLTSLKATELVAALEQLVGRSLPVTIAYQHPTLAALQCCLVSESSADGGGEGGEGGEGAADLDSLQALSDAAIAAAPHIDEYARLTFVHTPYLNTSMRAGHRSDVICTDRHGFRISHDADGVIDSDSWPRRPRRALALGNSFMFGWGASNDAETIPSLLSAGTDHAFLNLATAGANSFQEVISAAPFLADAELIVIGGGLSNLLRVLEHEPHNDLFGGFVGREFWAFVRELDFRHITELLDPGSDLGPDAQALPPARQEAAAQLRRAMAEHAEGFVRWQQEGWSEAEVTRRFEQAIAHHRRDLELLVRAKAPSARILYLMQPMATLAKPHLSAEERGLLAVHQHYNTMWRHVFEPYAERLLPDFIAAVAANCEALGVPYTDLNHLDYQGWCFCDQGHINDRGNRIVAEFLVGWINQQMARG